MEQCSDDELLYLLRAGNEEALICLYNRYNSYAKKWMLSFKKYICFGYDYEDYLQMIMLYFFDAVGYYRSDQKTSLKTFLRIVMTRRLKNMIRQSKDLKFQSQVLGSLDAWSNLEEKNQFLELFEDTKDEIHPQKAFLIKETKEYYQIEMDKKASLLEKQVMHYKEQGYKPQEIAHILSISLKSVHNSLYRYHKKILTIDEFK
jgi:DNA-directed RNA polymerase specialized sigma subunit, sigma24 homolog